MLYSCVFTAFVYLYLRDLSSTILLVVLVTYLHMFIYFIFYREKPNNNKVQYFVSIN